MKLMLGEAVIWDEDLWGPIPDFIKNMKEVNLCPGSEEKASTECATEATKDGGESLNLTLWPEEELDCESKQQVHKPNNR